MACSSLSIHAQGAAGYTQGFDTLEGAAVGELIDALDRAVSILPCLPEASCICWP